MLATVPKPRIRANYRHATDAESIVGGDGLRFVPELRCLRWGQECDFSLRLPSQARALPKLDGDKITWEDERQKIGFVAYPLDFAFEDGGLEFEILLFERPRTKELRLPIESTGLRLNWQGELSDWEKRRGNIRPANVLHSIAAYHSWKKDNEYKTGKAFHLYRFEAIDATGRRHWVNWRLEERAIVVRYDDWFRTAAYPVIVDPTIGYTSDGASTDNTGTYMLAQLHTAGASGDATTAHCRCARSGSNINMKVAGYAGGDSDPQANSKVSTGDASISVTSATMSNLSAALTWTGITSGTAYFVSNGSDVGGQTAYDGGGGNTIWYGLWATGTMPNPWDDTGDVGSFAGDVSVYVTFTAGGGTGKPWNYYHQAG